MLRSVLLDMNKCCVIICATRKCIYKSVFLHQDRSRKINDVIDSGIIIKKYILFLLGKIDLTAPSLKKNFYCACILYHVFM